MKMSGLVHIFASYRKTKKKSIIVRSVYCHGRMLSDAPFGNILFSPRAGVWGVRSDRVHSRLHLHHTWRLDIRWATGLDSSAYSGGMLISVWISEHVYFTVSSGQRSSRYMRESRGHRKYWLWHCDCVIVTVKQRACSEIHTNTQNRGHPVNQVGIIDNKKWHGRVRRRKTLGYSNNTQAYIHGFLTAYHINIFMLLCTKNFAERVGRRCCFSWNVYAVFTLHPANFSKVWADLEKVTSNSVA